MDNNFKNSIDIEDQYDMVPILPEEMQFNIPSMGNYSMQDEAGYMMDIDPEFNMRQETDIETMNMYPMNKMDMQHMNMCPMDKMDMQHMNMCPMNKMDMQHMNMYPMDNMNMGHMDMCPMNKMNWMSMMHNNMCQMPMNPMHGMMCCCMPCMPIMPYMDNMRDENMPELMRDEFMEENDEDDSRYRPEDVEKILKKIEYNNPEILRMMRRCGMSYEEARRLCRRIISLTLKYCEK